MVQKVVKATIYGLKRDDQDWVPEVGSTQEFTDEEAKAIDEQSPGALVDLKDEEERLAAGGIRQVRQTSLVPGAVNENADAGQGGAEHTGKGDSATISTAKSREAAGGDAGSSAGVGAGGIPGGGSQPLGSTDGRADPAGTDEGGPSAADKSGGGKGSKSKGDDL